MMIRCCVCMRVRMCVRVCVHAYMDDTFAKLQGPDVT